MYSFIFALDQAGGERGRGARDGGGIPTSRIRCASSPSCGCNARIGWIRAASLSLVRGTRARSRLSRAHCFFVVPSRPASIDNEEFSRKYLRLHARLRRGASRRRCTANNLRHVPFSFLSDAARCVKVPSSRLIRD